MPRVAGVWWHEGNGCWASEAGEANEKGRRQTVYFRDIPKGPKGSPNHRKAKAALDKFLAARDAKVEAKPDDLLTFGAIGMLYLDHLVKRVALEKSKENTLRSHAQALKRFSAAKGFGGRRMFDRPAHEITGTEVGAILDRWAEDGMAPNYAGRILSSVQAVLNWAATPSSSRKPEKLIALNPIAKLSHEATQAPQSADRYAEEAEVRAFLAWGYARAEQYQRIQKTKAGRVMVKSGPLEKRFERLTIDLIRVAYLTGTRPGELRIAEWTDYDPKSVRVAALGQDWGRIRLDPKRWKSGGKTGKPRDVYLPPEAVDVIEAIRQLDGHHPRFIWTHKRGPIPRVRQATLARDDEALPSHGVMWSESALPTKVCALRRLAIAAGVPLEDEGDNRFVMYRLRHSRAAELLMGGVDVGTVARLLGTSVDMIEKTYGSYTSQHLAEAAAKGIALPPAPTQP